MAGDAGRRRRWVLVGLGVVAGGLLVAAPLSVVAWSRVWHEAGRVPAVGWVLTGCGVVAVAAVITVWSRLNPPAEAARRPVQVLPTWLVMAGIVTVILVSVIVTVWLLAEANNATSDRAQARIDAIRTGLAAGAGTGAGFALVLARPPAAARRTHPAACRRGR